MEKKMKRLVVVGLLMMLSPVTFVVADSSPQAKDDAVPAMMRESTIKTIIDLVSRSVSRRYDLRPEQADVARQMLEKNTMDFVGKHYDELLVLVPQMQDLRMKAMSGQEPSPDQVQSLAMKMSPIYNEAVALIVKENDKFHEILDDQQKVKHQRDMDQMKKDVSQTQEKLARWKKGEYKPGEFMGRRGQMNKHNAAPNSEAGEERTSQTSLSYWEEYVKLFIESYQLDAGQIPMAYAVLNDIKKQAKAYRPDHTREFAEVKDMIARLSRSSTTQPNQDKELKKWKDKELELEKPLLGMFDELAQRLMAIPTDEQRKAAQDMLGQGAPASGEKEEKAEKK